MVQLTNCPVQLDPSHLIWRRTWLNTDALQPLTMTSSPISCIQPSTGGDTGRAQPITAHHHNHHNHDHITDYTGNNGTWISLNILIIPKQNRIRLLFCISTGGPIHNLSRSTDSDQQIFFTSLCYVPDVAKRSIWDQCNINDRPTTDRPPFLEEHSWKNFKWQNLSNQLSDPLSVWL